MGVEKLGGSIHPESCFVRLENCQLLCYAGYFQGLFQGRNLFQSLSVSGPPPCLQSGGTSGVFKMKLISWASLPEILIELVTGRAQASGIFQTNKQAEPRTHGNQHHAERETNVAQVLATLPSTSFLVTCRMHRSFPERGLFKCQNPRPGQKVSSARHGLENRRGGTAVLHPTPRVDPRLQKEEVHSLVAQVASAGQVCQDIFIKNLLCARSCAGFLG